MTPDGSNETVTPATLSMSPATITVNGADVGDQSRVKVMSGNAVLDGGQLNIRVKAYKHRNVAIHAITQKYTTPRVLATGKGDPNAVCIRATGTQPLNTDPAGDDVVVDLTITAGPDGICNTVADSHDQQIIQNGQGIPKSLAPHDVPTAAAVEQYLNRAYGVQANLYFSVTRTDFDVDYDKNGNGLLEFTVIPNTSYTDEEQAIKDVASSASADFNIYFVLNSVGHATVNGVDYPDSPVGWALSKKRIAYINGYNRTLPGHPNFIFQCLPEKSVAHEIGHLLGLRHPERNHLPLGDFNDYGEQKNRLMYPDPNLIEGGFILIKPEWDIVNPDPPKQ